MKKNVMMRVASAMLVLTLLTTCVISGTFAKYVTKSDDMSDSARVAKWGVTIEGSGTTFADAYKDQVNDDAFASYPQEPNAGITVRSDTENTKVVAPGTHGALAAISISGTPEVSVDITYAATLTLSNWTIPGAEGTTEKYCPIVITVNGKDYRVGTGDATANTVYAADSDALVTAVNDAISGYSKSYAAGTNLADQSAENLAISWKWDFAGTAGAYQTDAKDTALGNWSDNEMDAPTISLTVTATATQKD